MKKLNVFWKIVLIMLTVFIIGIFAILLLRYIEDRYGKSWYTTNINENYTGQGYADGHVRLFNNKTEKATTPRLDWITAVNPKDTITVFSNKDKRGYINLNTGKIFISERYEHAWIFSDGLAAVVLNDKLGFINTKGKMVIPFQYHYNTGIDFVFKAGLCPVPDTSEKYGIIDKTGAWKLKPEFDYIFNPVKGYRVVKKGELYGVIDSLLQWIIPVQYEWIKVSHDGFVIMDDHIQKLYAFDAKTILQPYVYDEYEELFCNSQNDFGDESHNIYVRSDYTAVRMHDLWGVINQNGDMVVPVQYDEVTLINYHTLSCRKGNYWVTLTIKGKVAK
jgi:hypothetical protein